MTMNEDGVEVRERPGVKISLGAKGEIKPEVHSYGATVEEAGHSAQREFNRLCRSYGIPLPAGADA